MITKHPTLPAEFFTGNRKRLMEKMISDSLAVLSSSEWMVRNNDVRHPWRQDSDFFYLTGIEQSDCFLMLIPENTSGSSEILFIPAVDPELEKWEGTMLTVERAKAISGIDTVMTADQLNTVFFRAQKWKENVYCQVNDIFPNQSLTQHHLFLENVSRRLPGLNYKKLAPLLAELRVAKQPVEIEAMRKSIEIINLGLRASMKKAKPGMQEYVLEAEMAYHYLANGCSRLGFETIVASGKNGATLHYTANAGVIGEQDLVLMDTGGEYSMYTGDITRTFPANGKYEGRAKECYQAVLEVQVEVLKAIQPGMTLNELYKKSDKIQGEIMAQKGFVKSPEEHKQVTFHRIGHYLGLDVHDVGNPDWVLKPGAVITIEPGLYLPEEGIGIRIEDDILITENGYENLSQQIPKTTEEIEAVCNS